MSHSRLTRALGSASAFVAAIAVLPCALGAQGGVGAGGGGGATIVGHVTVKGSDIPVGYAVVGTAATRAGGGREQFTGADGRFILRDLVPGRVAVFARRIGYAPVDTALDVAANDTVQLRLELALVTIQLPVVHSLAKACAHPGGSDAQIGVELAVLFEQMKENADRNRLLSRSYPFELEIERRMTKPEPALEARFIAFDTVLRSSERDWRYAPGKMIGTREYASGAFGGKWLTVTMPELADFADERFLTNHCFDFGGSDVVDGDTLLRIDFSPAPVVHDPDVGGTIYLDPKTFQLRMIMVALVNLTKQLREQVSGQSIRADFKEIIPGVPVLDHVSSIVYPRDNPKAPPEEPATETQRTLTVRFLKGKP